MEFETNNCHLVKYSNIKKIGKLKFKIPLRKYDLYLVDAFEDHNIDFSIHDDHIIASSISRADIYYFINECYYTDHFLEVIPPAISIPSTAFELPYSLAEFFLDGIPHRMPPGNLVKLFNNALYCYPKTFIRLNSLSPHIRDHIHDPLFLISEFKKSPRITNTIKTMIEYKSPIYLVAREWIEMEPEMEFRCFIYKTNLTAISQYYSIELPQEKKNNICELISEFWDDNKDSVPYEDCVMDVFVDASSKVRIIEFGPFGIDLNAGSCSYNWLQDAHILYDAKCKFPDIR
jgi:hypothetical protein